MQNKYDNKCTILINSCDAFSDVWDLFFKSLEINWPTCKYKIVLNTETKKYNKYNVKTINFEHRLINNSWGNRYKHVLKQIDTPYVIPILDDFVLKDRFLGDTLIEKCIDWLDNYSDIAVFYFRKHLYALNQVTEFPNFCLLPSKCDYKLTTGIGIWRKTILNKTLCGYESPWEWEINRSKRVWKFNERFYAMIKDEPPIFNFPYGGVIRRGLWNLEAKELSEKYDVAINFSNRGFMDENDPFRIKKNCYSVIENFPKDIFKFIFWKNLVLRLLKRIREGLLEIC